MVSYESVVEGIISVSSLISFPLHGWVECLTVLAYPLVKRKGCELAKASPCDGRAPDHRGGACA